MTFLHFGTFCILFCCNCENNAKAECYPLPPFPNLSDNLYIQDLIFTTPNLGITGMWYRIRNYLIMRNGYLYLLNFEIIEIKSFFFSGTIHPVILFCKPISSLLNII